MPYQKGSIGRKFLYFITGCAVIGFVFAFVFSLLPMLPYVAKGVLFSISQKQYTQAYSVFSDDFKKQYSLATFESMAQKSGLDQYQDVKWFENVVEEKHNRGYLKGLLTTKQGTKMRIEMHFVRGKGVAFWDTGWRVSNIYINSKNDSQRQ